MDPTTRNTINDLIRFEEECIEDVNCVPSISLFMETSPDNIEGFPDENPFLNQTMNKTVTSGYLLETGSTTKSSQRSK